MSPNEAHPTPSPEEKEVRALHRALLDAWNDMDAAAFAARFAADGSSVGFDGSPLDGRPAIEAELGRIFADHAPARYVAIVREVRALAPGAVLLRAVAGMVPRGGTELKPEVNAVQGLVAVRRDGGWRIALFQNTPAAFHGRPELAGNLTEELRAAAREQLGIPA